MNSTFLTTRQAAYPALFENNWLLFALIIIISLGVTFSGQYLLLSDELYFNALAEQLTFEQIRQTIDQTHQWDWLTYVIIPFFNLLKFTLVASCLSLGYYFAVDRWMFKPFFRIAIQAEMVLLLPAVIKLFWFLFVKTDYSLTDLQMFYPLSALSLFGADSVASYLLYPLQLTNLFELAYWLGLAYGISQVIELPMPRAFGLVAASYGLGLLVWVAFVMFLTVSLA